MEQEKVQVYTIGHSSRDLKDFLGLLDKFSIEAIVDVRRFPSSRKFPHFNRGDLEKSLADANIQYSWWEQLGGCRQGESEEASPNTGLEDPGFRNYADYMMTDAFREAVHEFVHLAARRRTAIMCAEKPFWKCHRSLVSDYLVANGHRVCHILDAGDSRSHALSEMVRIQPDGSLVYEKHEPELPFSESL